MDICYRASLIKMLKPETTYIREDMDRLKRRSKEVSNSLLQRARLHIVWFGILATLVTGLTLLIVQVELVYLLWAITPSLIAPFFYKSSFGTALAEKMSGWSTFSAYHERQKALTRKMGELLEPAKAYQKALELSDSPGFLSIYGDVLLSHHFECEFTLDKRIRLIEQSKTGKGSSIEVSVYGALLKELKRFDFDFFLLTQNDIGVDRIKASTKTSVIFQCAYMLSRHFTDQSARLSECAQDQTLIIARNAVRTIKKQGLPLKWSNINNMSLIHAEDLIAEMVAEGPNKRSKANQFLASLRQLEQDNSELVEQIRSIAA